MHIQITDLTVGPFKYGPAGTVMLGRYVEGGSLAIFVMDPKTHEKIMTASALPEDVEPPEGHVYLKDWGGNEGCAYAFLHADLVEPTNETAQCGFVTAGLYKLIGGLAEWAAKVPEVPEG